MILSGQTDGGYLASVTSTEFGYGSSGCPWRLQAAVGQTFRLTLLSFGASRRTGNSDGSVDPDGGGGGPMSSEVCYEIGEIRDGATRTTMSMCGGGTRESVVYVSTGSDVIVQLLPAEVLRGLSPFVVKYEGNCEGYDSS